MRRACIIAFVAVFGLGRTASAQTFPEMAVDSVESAILDGPAHHGIVIHIAGIVDPDLTGFEVQFRKDAIPTPPWQVYSTQLKPFDSASIIIPYRNGIQSLQAGISYCIRVRPVYAATVSPWAQKCGVTVVVGPAGSGDSDDDGMADNKEYALGIDPNNPDTDGDGKWDGEEVAKGSNPDKFQFANLEVLTPTIDFGAGDGVGSYPTQHRALVIRNSGDQTLKLESLELVDDSFPGSAQAFKLGAFPQLLSNIPPKNVVHIPVSFLPQWRGPIYAKVIIKNDDIVNLPPVKLSGLGFHIPDCQVNPKEVNFGTVKVDDPGVSVKYITITNQSPDGDPFPNVDIPFGFVVRMDQADSMLPIGVTPGLQGLILPEGQQLNLPVLFTHPAPGVYDGTITISSVVCGVQKVAVKATAE